MAERARRRADRNGASAKSAASQRALQLVRDDADDDEPPDREMSLVCDALCAVEAGTQLGKRALPQAVACWFLDHAAHFQPVAYAALRLMEQLAHTDDAEVAMRLARAAGAFAALRPLEAEQVLLALSGWRSAGVREAIVDTLLRLFRESDDPVSLVARWSAHGRDSEALVDTAQRLVELGAL
jgi:hypothetical protein